MSAPSPQGDTPARASGVFIGLATVAILYFARQVLVPVALAVLLTFVLTPIVTWIERRVRSRALAVVLATLMVGTVAGGGILIVAQQFAGLSEDLPTYRDTVVRKIRAIQTGPGMFLGRATDALRKMGEDITRASPDVAPVEGPPAPDAEPAPTTTPPRVKEPDGILPGAPTLTPHSAPMAPLETSWAILSSTFEPLSSAAVVILLLIMMLMSRESIRDRVIRLAGLSQIGLTTQTLEEAGARVGRYLRAQLLINSLFAVAVGAGLMTLGLPNAALCGVLGGVLRFIPIIGPWIAAAVPAALALAVFDDWYHVVLVIVLFACLELITNMVMEPWLYGTSTGLSSVGVILAIIFWTWIWGAVGLVLAVPMTVCVVVFTRNIPDLSGLSTLLGDEPVLADSLRLYQRLLCNDEEEAAAILTGSPPDADVVEVLDATFLPSLSAARADLRRGLISPAQAARIGIAARDLALEWLADRDATRPQGPMPPRGVELNASVLCMPAQDELDEAAAMVLAELLRREGVNAAGLGVTLLVSERANATRAESVQVAVVSSVGPASELATRRINKALEKRRAGIQVLVASWVRTGSAEQKQTPANAGSTNRIVLPLVRSLLSGNGAPQAAATQASTA